MQKTLTQNILALDTTQGKKWLSELPNIINELVKHWELENITPVDNMTFNYVAKATQNNTPVVLKICYDIKPITEEKIALDYFHGQGAVKLLNFNEKYHAILLQQAIPGITLKSLYKTQPEYVMNCYVNTMHQLHDNTLPTQHRFPHIADWLTTIDNASNGIIPQQLLQKAISLKNQLLLSMQQPVFLHGDLHHDNILQNENEWIAIDPKGIVGEPEFEIAAFDFMYLTELANQTDIKNIFEQRIKMLAQKANLNEQRIKDWVFVRLILMAAWCIEDNNNPAWAIKLAELIY